MNATMTESYNPEYDPTGIEGGVDANKLPWIPVPGVDGMFIKPLRAGSENGMFSVIVKLNKDASIPSAVYLGGMDMLVLSGEIDYRQDNERSLLEPGIWGYISANSRVGLLTAREDAEFLANFYNAVVFLSPDGICNSILTSVDVQRLAIEWKITLVPSTLAECAKPRENSKQSSHIPLAISSVDARTLVIAGRRNEGSLSAGPLSHPHFVDTRKVPWASNGGMSDIALKILRISEETQTVSLIVRHNGSAPPHTHLGSSDFLILHGRIGYRAGPAEGYGPGIWFFEPAGARHDATQRVTDEDLIYTANIYGPIVFDSGRGTSPTAVLSWMEYKAMAKAAGSVMVPSPQTNDATVLAWSPLRVA